jgi:predicted nucleotidyltransferase component of viral defense system
MSLSEKDYSKLYQLQDKFLTWWAASDFPFYLTGGTALGRFYLHHRLSEDLDFFVNADDNYLIPIGAIKNKISAAFQVNIDQTLFSDNFTRLFIAENDTTLKIGFVNDAKHYAGVQSAYQYGRIDTPTNILANKLTALIGRDKPKDIFDIIEISLNYSFNWMD